MSFADPGLLLLALVAAPAVVWMGLTCRTDRGPLRRTAQVAFRLAMVLLVSAALAGPGLETRSHRLAVMLVIDRTGSLAEVDPEETLDQAAALLRGQDPTTMTGVILIGRSPVLALRPRTGVDRAALARALDTPVDGSETDIESALRMAWLSFPAQVERRIVLLSDGNQTTGDARRLADRLGRDGVPVSVVPLRNPGRRITLDPIALSTRSCVLGESVELGVSIHASEPTLGELQIEVAHTRPRSLRRTVRLTRGKNGPFLFTFQPGEKGAHHLRAIFTPAAGGSVSRTAFLDVSSTMPRVLLVEGTKGKERFLSQALSGERIDVETRPPAGLPSGLWDLVRYDCVILSDVPASRLTRKQMSLIRHYVEERGGGFIMVGGENSFGLGGYYRTPIEPLLPVKIEIPRRKEIPSMAIVLAIDKSGSMSGKKMALARDAAIAVIELLGRKDWIGVAAFDSAAEVVVPLQKVIGRASITDRVARMRAGGGTYFYPALQEAYKALGQVKAKVKHVILFSDGHTQPADHQSLITRMVLDRITVSTVAFGNEAAKGLMKRMAEWGRGRYYFTSDEYNLPQIFAQETIKASKSSLKEIPFRPEVYHRHQVVRGIDFANGPYLQGYVATAARRTAEVPLVHAGDPVLAVWQYGLGKVAAFTSDAKDRWAAMWLEWDGFPKLWAQLVREVIRRKVRPTGLGRTTRIVSGQLSVTPRGRELEIALDLVDDRGSFLNQQKVTAQLVRQDPKGGVRPTLDRTVTLEQHAPGRYRATAALDRPGTYLVRVRAAGTDLAESSDVEVTPSGETLSRAAVDQQLIDALTHRTGGAVSPTATGLQTPRLPPRPRRRPIWPWLLLAAAILLPVDLAVRRVVTR